MNRELKSRGAAGLHTQPEDIRGDRRGAGEGLLANPFHNTAGLGPGGGLADDVARLVGARGAIVLLRFSRLRWREIGL